MTRSFVEVTGEGEKKLAPDSCMVEHKELTITKYNGKLLQNAMT